MSSRGVEGLSRMNPDTSAEYAASSRSSMAASPNALHAEELSGQYVARFHR